MCVDRLIGATSTQATTEYDVRPGPHLEADGHLWCGALVEGLAQTAAVLAAQADGAPREGLFVGARGVRFGRRPRAGETIRYTVDVIKALGPLVLIAGVARCGDDVVAEGNLKLYAAEP